MNELQNKTIRAVMDNKTCRFCSFGDFMPADKSIIKWEDYSNHCKNKDNEIGCRCTLVQEK